MKIYTISNNQYNEIFDTRIDEQKEINFTTSFDLQKKAYLILSINKQSERRISFNRLPPAKKNFVNISLVIKKKDEQTVEVIKKYFLSREVEILSSSGQSSRLSSIKTKKNYLLPVIGLSLLFLAGLFLIPFFINYLNHDVQKPSRQNNKAPAQKEKMSQAAKINKIDKMDKIDKIDKIEKDMIDEKAVTHESGNNNPGSQINANAGQANEEQIKVARDDEARQKIAQLDQFLRDHPLYFIKDRTELIKGENDKLQQIVASLSEFNSLKIEIEGHTARIGREKNELNLSRARAVFIKDFILENKVQGLEIIISYYGSSKPVVPNPRSNEEKQLNRRVNIKRVE